MARTKSRPGKTELKSRQASAAGESAAHAHVQASQQQTGPRAASAPRDALAYADPSATAPGFVAESNPHTNPGPTEPERTSRKRASPPEATFHKQIVDATLQQLLCAAALPGGEDCDFWKKELNGPRQVLEKGANVGPATRCERCWGPFLNESGDVGGHFLCSCGTEKAEEIWNSGTPAGVVGKPAKRKRRVTFSDITPESTPHNSNTAVPEVMNDGLFGGSSAPSEDYHDLASNPFSETPSSSFAATVAPRPPTAGTKTLKRQSTPVAPPLPPTTTPSTQFATPSRSGRSTSFSELVGTSAAVTPARSAAVVQHEMPQTGSGRGKRGKGKDKMCVTFAAWKRFLYDVYDGLWKKSGPGFPRPNPHRKKNGPGGISIPDPTSKFLRKISEAWIHNQFKVGQEWREKIKSGVVLPETLLNGKNMKNKLASSFCLVDDEEDSGNEVDRAPIACDCGENNCSCGAAAELIEDEDQNFRALDDQYYVEEVKHFTLEEQLATVGEEFGLTEEECTDLGRLVASRFGGGGAPESEMEGRDSSSSGSGLGGSGSSRGAGARVDMKK